MQEITWKLYSPLQADYFPQEVYDDQYLMDREGPMELDGESIVEYAEDIRHAIARYDSDGTDLADYIDSEREQSIDGKVTSIKMSVAVLDGQLKGCATVKLREPLTESETAALREYMTGQYSDGWGEGFEQREIEINDGVLFVHFWNSERFGIEIDRQPQTEQTAQRPKLRIDLTGANGNVYAVLALVSEKLNKSGRRDRAVEMCGRVFEADSYEAALAIMGEYMEIEYIRPAQPDRASKPKKKGDEAR